MASSHRILEESGASHGQKTNVSMAFEESTSTSVQSECHTEEIGKSISSSTALDSSSTAEMEKWGDSPEEAAVRNEDNIASDRTDENNSYRGRKNERHSPRRRSQTPFARGRPACSSDNEDSHSQEGSDTNQHEDRSTNQQTLEIDNSVLEKQRCRAKRVSFSMQVATCDNEAATNASAQSLENGIDAEGRPQRAESREGFEEKMSTHCEPEGLSATKLPSQERVGRRAGRANSLSRKRSQTPFNPITLQVHEGQEDQTLCDDSEQPGSHTQGVKTECSSDHHEDKRKVRFSGGEAGYEEEDDTEQSKPARRSSSSALPGSQSIQGKHTGMKYSHEEFVRRFMSVVTSDGEHDTDELTPAESDDGQNGASVSFALEPEIINMSDNNSATDPACSSEKSTSCTDHGLTSSPRGRQTTVGSKISKRDKTPFRYMSLGRENSSNEVNDGSSPRSQVMMKELESRDAQPDHDEKHSSGALKARVKFSNFVSYSSSGDQNSRGRLQKLSTQETKRDQTPFNPKRFDMPCSEDDNDGKSLDETEQGALDKPGSIVRFAKQVECICTENELVRASSNSSWYSEGTQGSGDPRGRPMTPRGKISQRRATPFSTRNKISGWLDEDGDSSSSIEHNVDDENQRSSSTEIVTLCGEKSGERNQPTNGKFEKGTQTGMMAQISLNDYGTWQVGDYELHRDIDENRPKSMNKQQPWVPIAIWVAVHVVGIGLCNYLSC